MAADDQGLLDALMAVVPPAPDSLSAPRRLTLVGPGPDPDGGPARAHYALWDSSQEVIRCRTPQRLVRSTVAWLDQWADERPGNLVGLRWMAALDPQDRAVLLPLHLRASLHPLEARLRRLGLRPVDSPLVDLDPDTGDLVVGPSAVAVGGSLPEANEAVPPGRFPVAHVMVPAAPDAAVRPAETLAILARSAVTRPPLGLVLAALSAVSRRARLHCIGIGTADEIAADLGGSLAVETPSH